MKKRTLIWIVSLSMFFCIGLIFLYEANTYRGQVGTIALHAVAPYTSSPTSVTLITTNISIPKAGFTIDTDSVYITSGKKFWRVDLRQQQGNWTVEHVQTVKQLPSDAGDPMTSAVDQSYF